MPTSLGSHVVTALQLLIFPVNLVAVLVGVLAGAVLGPLLRRLEITEPAALVVLLPFAGVLDPVTGLMFLGAGLVAATTRPIIDAGILRRQRNFARPILLASASAALLLVVVVGAERVGDDPAARFKIAALIAAACVSALVATEEYRRQSLPVLLSMISGLALEAGPAPPLVSDQLSPVPLLLGLLIAGRAVALSLRPVPPQRPPQALAPQRAVSLFEPGVLFLSGAPIGLGAALLMLNLADNGLSPGLYLLSQRPKLALGLAGSIIAAALLAVAADRLASLLRPRNPLARRWDTMTRTRMLAGMVIVLSAVVYVIASADHDGGYAVLDPSQLLRFVPALLVGAVATWMGFDLSWFVVALVIGQVLRAPFTALLDAAQGDVGGAILSMGFWPLLTCAASIATAIAWPLIRRRTSPPLKP